jgi:8-oxo-dGTP diphosphatase
MMIHVCAAIIKYLITSRPPNKYLAGQWEFPGGKVHVGESAHDCLVRELREELGVEIVPLEKNYFIDYEYPDKKVFLEFLKAVPVDIMNFTPMPNKGQRMRWEEFDRLCDIDWTLADLPLAKYLSQCD